MERRERRPWENLGVGMAMASRKAKYVLSHCPPIK